MIKYTSEAGQMFCLAIVDVFSVTKIVNLDFDMFPRTSKG